MRGGRNERRKKNCTAGFSCRFVVYFDCYPAAGAIRFDAGMVDGIWRETGLRVPHPCLVGLPLHDDGISVRERSAS